MKTYISMLRGINVCGQKKIAMSELRKMYDLLELTGAETYVQSGNVVFKSRCGNSAELAKLIENQIEKSFGYQVPVVIREMGDLETVMNKNPFLLKKDIDKDNLYITFFNSIPENLNFADPAFPADGDDTYHLGEKEIYLYCPNGYGRTKLSNNYFERKLKVPATTRNWKTVCALFDIAKNK
ncbi:MAG: DUF1697 domain-containing protein [Bacteroidota bacterium]|nr:DUF1697 domain-containing protein [Bacteroidota bacterium]